MGEFSGADSVPDLELESVLSHLSFHDATCLLNVRAASEHFHNEVFNKLFVCDLTSLLAAKGVDIKLLSQGIKPDQLVIAGSVTVKVVLGQIWPDSDVDLYTCLKGEDEYQENGLPLY
jgi:hypothetical protein